MSEVQTFIVLVYLSGVLTGVLTDMLINKVWPNE